ALLALTACNRMTNEQHEYAYVVATQVNLRDQVAAVYNKVGVLHNGDRVEVLDHNRRFVKVRTDDKQVGWIEQRYLVGQDVFDGFQKLQHDSAAAPAQAHGVTRNDTNLHLTPSRDADHLYQLKQGEKVVLVQRAVAAKPGPAVVPVREDLNKKNKKSEPPKPALEDWWLIRDSGGHTGWVLGRMIDLDIPLEIAQYAEGQRIVASFVLNQVKDEDKMVPQYLVVLTEPKDGMPFDYNQIRVFTWNVRRHRYETAYRERNLDGVLPVRVGEEDFGKEGRLPVFVLRVQGDNNSVIERKYKLNTPIVRRVLAPGEEKSTPSQLAAQSRHKHRKTGTQ
ncbi:MAG TPA: SH3 domain-containing protein, partial [Terriglobales bacterium]|nr:SH3 domain-containing protein [Terriglobales bacterium]